MESYRAFDSSKGSFSTLLYLNLNRKFRDISQNRMDLVSLDNFTPQDQTGNPERVLLFKEKLEALSKEAQEVVEVLFHAPAELLSLMPSFHSPYLFRGPLKRYLRSKGWKVKEVSNAFREIRNALR